MRRSTGLKIGLIKEFFDKGLDADVEKLHPRGAQGLREARREAGRKSNYPALPLSVPTYYVVAPAECSSNLARFDGVRYGHRCEDPKDLHGPLQALARRGLRRRGQAPHHDRHLCAVGRLLRRLLPQGAARARS